jgi:hydroxymethylbilane synthase
MPIRNELIIGARGSRLAMAQAHLVRALLTATCPAMHVEVQPFITTGDRLLDTPLPQIGGKGVFTEEIEDALLDGRIDLAIHSLKDLPVQQREGLIVGATPERGSVTDMLIGRTATSLTRLPAGARVGTSSLRRAAQLKQARPDLEPVSIRGNVETRLRKLSDSGESYDAIILARAGLERLGLLDRASEELPPEVMLPAPGQGAIAVQCRDEPAIVAPLTAINHLCTYMATTAERAFLAGLGGGCATPVAAYGWFEASDLLLRGRVLSPDGERAVDVVTRRPCASDEDATAAGAFLAQMAIDQGALELLGVPK